MSKFTGPESIKIRRIPKAGYFGISAYAKSITTLGCELGKAGFKTGLTPELETYYEGALELKKGELNKNSKWWSNVFNVEHPIRLNNTKVTEILLDTAIDQLKYYALLASSKVANSEIEKGPRTIFYIDNAEAKAKAEIETFNYKYEGAGLIHKMTPEEKRTNLRLFGKSGLDTMSENVLNSQLMGELEKNPKLFVEILQDKDLATKGLIKELVEKNILKRKGNYYMHGDDTIANSTEECVEYLNDKKNQSVRLILVSRLNKGKKVTV